MKFAILALLVGVAFADVDITDKRHVMYGGLYGGYPQAGYPGVMGTGMYGAGMYGAGMYGAGMYGPGAGMYGPGLYRKRRSTHGDVPSDTPFSPNTDIPITEKRHVMMGSPALGYGGMGGMGYAGMGYGGYPAYGAYGNGMYGAGMGGAGMGAYGQGFYGMMKKRDLDGVTRDVPSDRERRDIVIEDVVDIQYGRERRDVPQGPQREYPTPVVDTTSERNVDKRHVMMPGYGMGLGYGMGPQVGYGYGYPAYAGYGGYGMMFRKRRDVPQGPHSEYSTTVREYPTETERNVEKRHLGVFPGVAYPGYGMGYGTGYGNGYGYGRMGYAGYPAVGYAGYAGYPGAMLMKKRDVDGVTGDYPSDRQRREVPQGPQSEYSTPVVDTETERNTEKRHLGLGLFPAAGYGYGNGYGMGYGNGYGYGRMGYGGYPGVGYAGYAGYPGAMLMKKRDLDGVTRDVPSDRERREVPQGPHGEYPTPVVDTETERNVEKRHLGVYPGYGMGLGYGMGPQVGYGYGYPAAGYGYTGYGMMFRKRRETPQTPVNVEDPLTRTISETERNVNTHSDKKRHLGYGLGLGYPGYGYGYPGFVGRPLVAAPYAAAPMVAGPLAAPGYLF